MDCQCLMEQAVLFFRVMWVLVVGLVLLVICVLMLEAPAMEVSLVLELDPDRRS